MLTISVISCILHLVKELEHLMSRGPDHGILTSNQSPQRFDGRS
jgi:hypothetical protein